MSNSFGYWNAITGALNPYIYDCSYVGCVDAIHCYASDMNGDLFTAAYTDWNDYGDVQFANGQYSAFQNSTTTYFNTSVTWNRSMTFSGYHVTPVQADGRKVATHETGHVEGLGHTARSNAVMKQGQTSDYRPMTDDISGIRAIHTGYIPS